MEGRVISEYAAYTTQFKDKECLLNALKEVGYSVIEDHEEAQQLFDFQGRKTKYLDKNGDKANIIVRRQYVGGAANDLGFKKEANGTFSAIVSAYDTHKHNEKWMNGLKRSYTEGVTTKEAKRQGLKFKSRTVQNGKIVLQYLKA